ncbi:hypothetical protein AWC14_06000 [Mycobacterium kyorinense]|uniref:Uncharacterized protein n=1 Tax=Mycobacterium kyorinense TaxID=487514 RepID=A0A1X1XVG6_9MYCO|nr:hypothetical protein AWC14_06000 [Mycobacterium kyorinense]
METGLAEQVSVLLRGALTARQIQQHLQIRPLSWEVAVVVGDDQFDQQQRRAGAGRRAHIAQDLHGLLVGPVVNDVLQDVGVAAARNAVEKRAGHDAHPVLNIGPAQQVRRRINNARQVVQHTAGGRRGLQDRGQQRAVPTADIHDRRVAAEVVAGHHRRDGQLRDACHGLVEQFGVFGMLGEVVEAARAVQRRDDGIARCAPNPPAGSSVAVVRPTRRTVPPMPSTPMRPNAGCRQGNSARNGRRGDDGKCPG